eukprot:2681381-Amphidinium_carterae.2
MGCLRLQKYYRQRVTNTHIIFTYKACSDETTPNQRLPAKLAKKTLVVIPLGKQRTNVWDPLKQDLRSVNLGACYSWLWSDKGAGSQGGAGGGDDWRTDGHDPPKELKLSQWSKLLAPKLLFLSLG